MARRTKVYPITSGDSGNRDKGKHFLITEMAASKGERLLERTFLALGNNNASLGEDIKSLRDGGWASLAVIGITSLLKLPFEEADPILSELMDCVQILPDPQHPEIVRNLVEDDTEEVSTRLLLKQEVLQLHTGFSWAGVLLSLFPTTPATAPDLSTTQTSPEASL